MNTVFITETTLSTNKLIYLNNIRWLVLSLVFLLLITLPFIHLYQTYSAAHAYDLLSFSEKLIFDVVALFSSVFVDSADQLSALKGTTWSATVFGFKISDPLAVLAQISASQGFYWVYIMTAAIPVLMTMVFGRFFCGWICPATFVYELNDNIAAWLVKIGFPTLSLKLDGRIKYLVLFVGVLLSGLLSSVVVASIYPPAIIGREIYYSIALDGFGLGMIFFLLTLAFDLVVSRRGFCRYLCPGGALYSMLGRYRLLRIRRDVTRCNDCAKCNVICQFGLDPLHDNFGMECNNCCACIAVCPTNALTFTVNINDIQYQGVGHLSHHYRLKHH